jgi:uncharacterized protein
LVCHSKAVAKKALKIAENHPELNIDKQFVEEASILHDIGIIYTHAPEIECQGDMPYICHGYLGADLLRKEGFPQHALVCERHTGTGLSLHHIIDENLPIPHRDMRPISIEEQLICFADKFFSKSQGHEKTVEDARKGLSKHGSDTTNKFDEWCKLFL